LEVHLDAISGGYASKTVPVRPEQGFVISCPCGKELGVVCDEKGAVRTLGYHLRQHLGQGETLAGHIALGVCR
jgi:hypothetical protein